MKLIACPKSALRTGLLAVLVATANTARADDARLDMHVLNRLAFGPTADSVAAIHRLGVDGWIDRQLHPETITEPEEMTGRIARMETAGLDVPQLFDRYGPPRKGGAADPDAAKAARQRARVILRDAAQARLLRAVDSPRQLQEVMVDFWFNHFNVFAGKGLDHLWVGDYEDRAIRPHVLGRFRDLLAATARHPAMLFYLDNWQNTAPGSPGARGRESGLNENYARELMELHTLGVDGGYTQDDVVALARILTGWGIIRPRQAGRIPSDNGFAFDADRHDFGDKVFLGQTVHGEGAAEIERALDILAESPATAHHVSFELAQYFVADQPPAALVDRLTRRWQDSGGDIRAVLGALFASPEFRDPANYGSKFKTPLQYVASAVRASGARVANFRPLFGAMKRLGEPLYGCPTPNGYQNTKDAWLNPDALTLRVSFATGLGSGHMRLDQPMSEDDDAPAPPGVASPVDSARLVALLGPTLSAKTRGVVAAGEPRLQAALVLGSPDFMTR